MVQVILVFEKCFWDEKAAMAGYISSTEKGAWASLLNLQSCMGKPALVACNAGAFAERLQSLSDTEIRAEAVSTLRIMYGDKFCEPIEVWSPGCLGSFYYAVLSRACCCTFSRILLCKKLLPGRAVHLPYRYGM